MGTLSADQTRAWLAQWTAATAALAEERRRTLAVLTDSEAAVAAVALLDLAALLPLSPTRRSTSGFVEQQRLFHRRLQ